MKLHYILVVLAVASCAYARTATRQQPLSAKITSLTDKNAKHKAMVHPAFANAGRQAGVEIWRIEDFEPVPVPQKDFGKFYKGDSYIVLKTTSDKRNNLSWDIHYWIGSESTQDESGAAAILTVGLDDKFNGAAVQHRESLGHESPKFLGYFQPAIRYLDGGHASGFNHVTTNAGAEKRLFQIKGKRNVRVRQVDPLISSMNKGDCFILDVNHDIYVYVGDKAKNVERLKAISVANQIRDQDHNGRARVEIIDQYSNEVDVEKFFTALGSGSRDTVPEDSAGGDDQAFERSEEQTVVLSEISDSSGKLKVTPLSKPYKQEQLKPQECYILDTVSGSIYVWVGKQSSEKEKTEAMSKAQQYLSAKNYPSWVHVSRIPQGTEPAAFKQYFTTWKDVGMSHSRIVRSLSEDEEQWAAKRGAAPRLMPDDGNSHFTVYRIENMRLQPVHSSSSPGSEPGERFGELYQGDSYVIQYDYEDGDGHIVYYWLGKDSTIDERAAAAMHSMALDMKLNGNSMLIRVPQGEEPKHFLKMFKGRFITLLGGKASGFRNSNQQDSYDTDGVRLFRIYGTSPGVDMRAEQVAEEKTSLNSDDVFLLETPEKNYVWYGQDSNDAEKGEAFEIAHHILGESSRYMIVNQGQEPPEFWTHLAGDEVPLPEDQPSNRPGKRLNLEPRLFEVTLSSDNAVNFEEFSDYSQKDMQQDEVYLMDSGEEIYLWLGKEVADKYRKSANQMAEGYLRRNGVHPGAAVVVVIKQGLEPQPFKDMFDKWDPDMWMKRPSYSEEKEAAINLNEIE